MSRVDINWLEASMNIFVLPIIAVSSIPVVLPSEFNYRRVSSSYTQRKNMLTEINPKLPMRDKRLTKEYYLNLLGFKEIADYGDYLIIGKDKIQIHFFEFKGLDPQANYGQIYIRTNEIDQHYQAFLASKVSIHPNGPLENKSWGQREFSVLDPDNNLLTFGQSIG